MYIPQIKSRLWGLLLIAVSVAAEEIFSAARTIEAASPSVDTLRLTLSEAILTALENNPAITIQRLDWEKTEQ